jgi:hypothetical protein
MGAFSVKDYEKSGSAKEKGRSSVLSRSGPVEPRSRGKSEGLAAFRGEEKAVLILDSAALPPFKTRNETGQSPFAPLKETVTASRV